MEEHEMSLITVNYQKVHNHSSCEFHVTDEKLTTHMKN